jgi:hypothetical protein
MKRFATVVVCSCIGLSVLSSAPAFAQAAPATSSATPLPKVLGIYREEVRPGKAAAHGANEAAWAAALAKGQSATHWLAMTSVAGPTEAWFFSAYDSWADLQKQEDSMAANAALTAEDDKFNALDGELLSRTSRIVASYRPAISYQPELSLPTMRYMSIDVVRVKPGKAREFLEAWRATIESHKTAKLDEHWAVYQVTAGQPDGTFFFIYPMKSLEEIDKAGPMHSDAAYRDAVGEGGRIRMNDMIAACVESSQRLVFALNSKMSLLDKQWAETDPFWAPKPIAVPATPAKKK